MATGENGKGKDGSSRNGGARGALSEGFAIARSWDWEQLFQKAPGLYVTGDMKRPYAEHPWVHAPVSVKAENIASVPLRVYRVPKVDPEDEGEPVESSHPLQMAADYPNPDCGGDDIEGGISISLDLYGEAFLLLEPLRAGEGGAYDPTAGPKGWWLVHPGAMQPEIDRATNRVRAWVMSTDSGSKTYPPERIVHIRTPNPYDTYRGLSPLEAARIEAEADHKASRWTEALLENGGDPGGILTTETTLDDDQVRVMRQRWRDRHEGPKNAGKIAILHGGLKWQSVATNAKDMEFSAQRLWSREALLAVFGVPKLLVGLIDDVNRATAQTTKRVFWEETLVPRLRRIERALNRQITRPMNRGPAVKGRVWEYRYRFDLSDVEALRENLEERMARAKELIAMGYGLNAVNARLGLGMEDVPWGDEPLASPTMVPISMLHETPGLFLGGGPDKEPGSDQDRGLRRAFGIITSRTRAQRRREIADAYYREFYHPAERRTLAGVRGYFRRVSAEQLEAIEKWAKKEGRREWPDTAPLTQTELDRLLLAPRYWSGAMEDLMSVPLGKVALEALEQLGGQMGGLAVVTPSLDEPWIDRNVARRIGAMARLAEGDRLILRQAIIKGITEGGISNIRGIRQEVSRVFTTMSAGRALTIARTETGMLANRMRRDGMVREGVEKREWITSNDENVRPSNPKQKGNHRVLDGEIVEGTEAYSNGLRWPMDPSGKAEEVVNCRCSEAPAD